MPGASSASRHACLCASCAISTRRMPSAPSTRRCRFATASSASGSIRPSAGTRRANSRACSRARATRAFFSPPMPARRGPPSYVWEALDLLGVARIDHGVRAMEDQALVGRLAREQVPLTVCPLSNVRLRVVDDLAHHPLRRVLDKGLMVTVNSDDPAYFGGYVNENYRASAQALGLARDEIAAIVRNGIEASLMATAEKDKALADVDRVLAATV